MFRDGINQYISLDQSRLFNVKPNWEEYFKNTCDDGHVTNIMGTCATCNRLKQTMLSEYESLRKTIQFYSRSPSEKHLAEKVLIEVLKVKPQSSESVVAATLVLQSTLFILTNGVENNYAKYYGVARSIQNTPSLRMNQVGQSMMALGDSLFDSALAPQVALLILAACTSPLGLISLPFVLLYLNSEKKKIASQIPCKNVPVIVPEESLPRMTC